LLYVSFRSAPGDDPDVIGKQASPIIPTFVLQTLYCVRMSQFDNLLNIHKIAAMAQAINALNAACDIMIAAAMVFLLLRSRTGLKQTNTIVNRLVLFVVNTGLLTSLFATAAIVCLLASPHTLWYAAFFFITPRLYANSLFATLNARASIRADAFDRHLADAFSLSFYLSSGPDNSEQSGTEVVGVAPILSCG
jgi:hypothetical protein